MPNLTAVARRSRALAAVAAGTAAATVGAACASSPRMVHDHGTSVSTTTTSVAVAPVPVTPAAAGTLPPDAAGAVARLNGSPRHGEYAMVRAGGDSVRAWVVYPERATKAPVVVVVHEIFGLSSWVRAVADQLAAEGFIAVAPDLLTGYAAAGNPDSLGVQDAIKQVSQLDAAQVQRRVAAAGAYGMGLAAAEPRYGVVGFCWGGSASFQHAVFAGQNGAPGYAASVVYYGAAPSAADAARIQAPVLGLYAGNDARVNATLPPADSVLRVNGRAHQFAVYPGAGHGFLRQQTGQDGANLSASRQAWPQTVAWFKRYLER